MRANNLEHIVLERLKCGLSTSAILAELSGAGVTVDEIERIDILRFAQFMEGPAVDGERRFRMPSFKQSEPRNQSDDKTGGAA